MIYIMNLIGSLTNKMNQLRNKKSATKRWTEYVKKNVKLTQIRKVAGWGFYSVYLLSRRRVL